ncbi:MAG: bifunctional phosphoribosylaminoimidazolecarboxamide formyltransferase/IMP cyclohydrolase [Patescibacteria group bacterium]
MIKRALVSVSDKTGIEELARELIELGVEIVSTGGTAKRLADAGVTVRTIDDLTGFPEMMDGRVKTLHPNVHGGILAVRDNPVHMAAAKEHHIEMIDLVVVNLYPFESKPSIENIDIGGPAMVRSAAKNYHDVIVVVDPLDYSIVLDELKQNQTVSEQTRYYLMQKAFAHTGYYDSMIANYMNQTRVFTTELSFGYRKVANLRYGENPHQAAAYYAEPLFHGSSIVQADILQGKQLSYNNIMDADAALRLIVEFHQPAAAIIKHTNPCGTAVADNITTAFTKAYETDSLSAFGGVVALNRTCTVEIAELLSKVFVEIILAPDFEDKAVEVMNKKPNVRLLKLGALTPPDGTWETRKILGGALVQDTDTKIITEHNLSFVTDNKPTKEQVSDLLFAWTVCKHVKSNAIVLAQNGVTLGVGAGQMSRIEAVNIALQKAGDKTQGAVLASDAFFPFRDSVDALAKAGVSAIIQPGGSVKDLAVIEAANEHNIAMVFTGHRAFLH